MEKIKWQFWIFRRRKRIFKCCPGDTTNKTEPNFLLTDLQLLQKDDKTVSLMYDKSTKRREIMSEHVLKKYQRSHRHSYIRTHTYTNSFSHSHTHPLCLSSSHVGLSQERKNARAQRKRNIMSDDDGGGATNANTIPKQMKEFKNGTFGQWERERGKQLCWECGL